jgi:hypothetical protein
MERVGELPIAAPLANRFRVHPEELGNATDRETKIRIRLHGETVAGCEGSLRIIAAR